MKRNNPMFESAQDRKHYDAIRAAHAIRGAVIRDALGMIFSRRR